MIWWRLEGCMEAMQSVKGSEDVAAADNAKVDPMVC